MDKLTQDRPPCPKCSRRVRRPAGADPAGLCWCCTPRPVAASRKGTVTPRVLRMLAMKDAGLGVTAIARELGISPQAVSKAVRKARPPAVRVLRDDPDPSGRLQRCGGRHEPGPVLARAAAAMQAGVELEVDAGASRRADDRGEVTGAAHREVHVCGDRLLGAGRLEEPR